MHLYSFPHLDFFSFSYLLHVKTYFHDDDHDLQLIRLLEDHSTTSDGIAVYQVAYQVSLSHLYMMMMKMMMTTMMTIIKMNQVIWSFLVEDSNLFLKYFMEKLTRDKQVMLIIII